MLGAINNINRPSRGILSFGIFLIGFVGLLSAFLFVQRAASAPKLPEGFQEIVVFSGLNQPTAVRFSPDGRVFVAEKSGLIKVFDSLADNTPDIFADLNVNVYNFWDRGLLGLALPPNFPADPYVYVLYTHDAEIGGTAPRWGTPGVYSDPCPSPPGPTANGCVVSGRLSRLEASGNFMVGDEEVLVEDWCQQYPSHSVGQLEFGPDGALYVSGGDGASFTFVDYGQSGDPLNPCGDPPAGAGGGQTPPTAEGGTLRSQDLQTGGDPVTLDGAILRVDPATGLGLPDNPLFSNPDANAQRIIAYGLRNPFRFTVHQTNNEIWVGDVGWNTWEEIDRIVSPTDTAVENFGWPCLEGSLKQPGYDAADLNICENLYQVLNTVSPPYYSYMHSQAVVRREDCPRGSSSISGIEFGPPSNSPYPSNYNNALYFADYSRGCIWAMIQGANGLPDPLQIETFVSPASGPVDLEISPSGELYYVDLNGGTIRRIEYIGENLPPTAVIAADPTSGEPPLIVDFDGTGSSDPNPADSLTYAWDLNGDGIFDDGSSETAQYTYTQPGSYLATLKVTDNLGLFDTDDVTILVSNSGNTPPQPQILAPADGTTWVVGDVVDFSGMATDAEDGTLPPSALTWTILIHHCPSTCHIHILEDFVGVSQGSFITPDHEYPSYLELKLTATDSGGLQSSQSIYLYPETVQLTFQTAPTTLQVAVAGTIGRSPVSITVIVGSTVSVSAISPQNRGGHTYTFSSWSDGGAQTHDLIAPPSAATYSAFYTVD